MRRATIAVLLMLTAGTAGATTPIAGSWADRLQTHQALLAGLQPRLRQMTDAFLAADDGDTTVRHAEAGGVYAATRTAAILNGRIAALTAWLAQMGAGPSHADAQKWLQARGEALAVEERSATLSDANLRANVAAGSVSPANVVMGIDRLYGMEGYSEGVALELAELSREVGAASWTATFGDTAGRLERQQRALRAWSLTCSQTEFRTNCAGD